MAGAGHRMDGPATGDRRHQYRGSDADWRTSSVLYRHLYMAGSTVSRELSLVHYARTRPAGNRGVSGRDALPAIDHVLLYVGIAARVASGDLSHRLLPDAQPDRGADVVARGRLWINFDRTVSHRTEQ